MRTNINLLTELQAYLTLGGFTAYIDRVPKDLTHEQRYQANGELIPYIVIKATPGNLARKDMRAAHNSKSVRTLEVFLACVADSRESAGELAESVDVYLMPDENEAWHCSDGSPLTTAYQGAIDPANSNSQEPIYISNLAYRCKKNLPNPVG
jgi:hypothetical protein